MNKKKLLKISLVILQLIILIVILVNVIQRVAFNNYISNSEKYFKNINYDTNIFLSINDNNKSSNISYTIRRSSIVINEEYKQYTDDNIITNISNYYVNNGKKIEFYRKNSSNYDKSTVDKIDTIFQVSYSDLKTKSKSVKYLGKERINSKNYLKYSVNMKVSDIYNLIYEEDILTIDDNKSNAKLYVYVDTDFGLIYKINADIYNLNNAEDDNSKLNYKIEIINQNFNNNKSIDLPFE